MTCGGESTESAAQAPVAVSDVMQASLLVSKTGQTLLRDLLKRDSHSSEATMMSISASLSEARSRPSRPPTKPSSAPRARFLPRLEVPLTAGVAAEVSLGSSNGDKQPRERRRSLVGYSTGTMAGGYNSRKSEWKRSS